MINKLQKYLLMPLLMLSFILNTGCGILNPPNKDANGFYTDHYTSCGPVAVQEALTLYSQINNISYKRPITSKSISQDIQRDAPIFIFNRTRLLIVFNRDAAGITWPSELKSACGKYGVKLTAVPVSDLYEDSNRNKTYIILTHKKWDLSSFHWYAYPGSSRSHFWGDESVFDIVYLLEPMD